MKIAAILLFAGLVLNVVECLPKKSEGSVAGVHEHSHYSSVEGRNIHIAVRSHTGLDERGLKIVVNKTKELLARGLSDQTVAELLANYLTNIFRVANSVTVTGGALPAWFIPIVVYSVNMQVFGDVMKEVVVLGYH